MNELDIRLVRCFVAVAEERSFTRASERLRIAQPWLSAQIRKLEDQLGFQLFNRNRNRAVTILPKGEAFLPIAQDYLIAAERATVAARRIQDRATVLLSLGAPSISAEMPVRVALIENFLATYPKFEAEISNAWTVELIQRLAEGKIDAAFTIGPHFDPYSEAHVLGRYRLSVLVATKDVPIAPRPLPLAVLAGKEVAIFRRNVNPAFYDSIAPILDAAGITVAHLPESSFSAILQFTQRTGIPALVCEWHADAPNIPGSLSVLALDEPALSFNLNLVRRMGDKRPAVSAFWNFAMNPLLAAA